MNIKPTDLYFRKVGVKRFVFNSNIMLCDMSPNTVVNFNVMHPSVSLHGAGQVTNIKDLILQLKNENS